MPPALLSNGARASDNRLRRKEWFVCDDDGWGEMDGWCTRRLAVGCGMGVCVWMS